MFKRIDLGYEQHLLKLMHKDKIIPVIVNIQEDEDGYTSHDIFNVPVIVPQKEKSKPAGNKSQRKAPVDDKSKSFNLLTAMSGT
ncbi:MAG: hypothetical protein JNJ86_09020 [Chitinophagaceae bacterium]|nr:hypothetical protein [Chitinophagaceae bacterium]